MCAASLTYFCRKKEKKNKKISIEADEKYISKI